MKYCDDSLDGINVNQKELEQMVLKNYFKVFGGKAA